MKEQELRLIIREHIKKLMKEAGPSLGAGAGELERGLGKVEKRASGLPLKQRVAAVIPILQKFGLQPSDLSLVKLELSKALKQSAVQDASVEKAEADKEEEAKAKADAEAKAATKAATKEEPTEEPTKKEEQYTAGVDDNYAGKAFKRPKAMQENLSSLRDKGEKLDKTQAFQMLQRSLAQKPSTMQADFVVDLINKFNLDDSAKRRLKMIIKNMS